MQSFLFAATLFSGLSLAKPVVPTELPVRSSSSSSSSPRRRSDPTAPLRFNDDGTFQLSIFEDLHFGESTFLCQKQGYDCRQSDSQTVPSREC